MAEPVSLLAASETTYLEITFRRALCIWWAYFWRHMLYGGSSPHCRLRRRISRAGRKPPAAIFERRPDNGDDVHLCFGDCPA